MNLPTTLLTFTDDTQRAVPPRLAAIIVGVDRDGDLLVPLFDEDPDGDLVALTPCCHSSATGVSGGIACRTCYHDVDHKYGGTSTLAAARTGGVADPHDVMVDLAWLVASTTADRRYLPADHETAAQTAVDEGLAQWVDGDRAGAVYLRWTEPVTATRR